MADNETTNNITVKMRYEQEGGIEKKEYRAIDPDDMNQIALINAQLSKLGDIKAGTVLEVSPDLVVKEVNEAVKEASGDINNITGDVEYSAPQILEAVNEKIDEVNRSGNVHPILGAFDVKTAEDIAKALNIATNRQPQTTQTPEQEKSEPSSASHTQRVDGGKCIITKISENKSVEDVSTKNRRPLGTVYEEGLFESTYAEKQSKKKVKKSDISKPKTFSTVEDYAKYMSTERRDYFIEVDGKAIKDVVKNLSPETRKLYENYLGQLKGVDTSPKPQNIPKPKLPSNYDKLSDAEKKLADEQYEIDKAKYDDEIDLLTNKKREKEKYSKYKRFVSIAGVNLTFEKLIEGLEKDEKVVSYSERYILDSDKKTPLYRPKLDLGTTAISDSGWNNIISGVDYDKDNRIEIFKLIDAAVNRNTAASLNITKKISTLLGADNESRKTIVKGLKTEFAKYGVEYDWSYIDDLIKDEPTEAPDISSEIENAEVHKKELKDKRAAEIKAFNERWSIQSKNTAFKLSEIGEQKIEDLTSTFVDFVIDAIPDNKDYRKSIIESIKDTDLLEKGINIDNVRKYLSDDSVESLKSLSEFGDELHDNVSGILLNIIGRKFRELIDTGTPKEELESVYNENLLGKLSPNMVDFNSFMTAIDRDIFYSKKGNTDTGLANELSDKGFSGLLTIIRGRILGAIRTIQDKNYFKEFTESGTEFAKGNKYVNRLTTAVNGLFDRKLTKDKILSTPNAIFDEVLGKKVGGVFNNIKDYIFKLTNENDIAAGYEKLSEGVREEVDGIIFSLVKELYDSLRAQKFNEADLNSIYNVGMLPALNLEGVKTVEDIDSSFNKIEEEHTRQLTGKQLKLENIEKSPLVKKYINDNFKYYFEEELSEEEQKKLKEKRRKEVEAYRKKYGSHAKLPERLTRKLQTHKRYYVVNPALKALVGLSEVMRRAPLDTTEEQLSVWKGEFTELGEMATFYDKETGTFGLTYPTAAGRAGGDSSKLGLAKNMVTMLGEYAGGSNAVPLKKEKSNMTTTQQSDIRDAIRKISEAKTDMESLDAASNARKLVTKYAKEYGIDAESWYTHIDNVTTKIMNAYAKTNYNIGGDDNDDVYSYSDKITRGRQDYSIKPYDGPIFRYMYKGMNSPRNAKLQEMNDVLSDFYDMYSEGVNFNIKGAFDEDIYAKVAEKINRFINAYIEEEKKLTKVDEKGNAVKVANFKKKVDALKGRKSLFFNILPKMGIDPTSIKGVNVDAINDINYNPGEEHRQLFKKIELIGDQINPYRIFKLEPGQKVNMLDAQKGYNDAYWNNARNEKLRNGMLDEAEKRNDEQRAKYWEKVNKTTFNESNKIKLNGVVKKPYGDSVKKTGFFAKEASSKWTYGKFKSARAQFIRDDKLKEARMKLLMDVGWVQYSHIDEYGKLVFDEAKKSRKHKLEQLWSLYGTKNEEDVVLGEATKKLRKHAAHFKEEDYRTAMDIYTAYINSNEKYGRYFDALTDIKDTAGGQELFQNLDTFMKLQSGKITKVKFYDKEPHEIKYNDKGEEIIDDTQYEGYIKNDLYDLFMEWQILYPNEGKISEIEETQNRYDTLMRLSKVKAPKITLRKPTDDEFVVAGTIVSKSFPFNANIPASKKDSKKGNTYINNIQNIRGALGGKRHREELEKYLEDYHKKYIYGETEGLDSFNPDAGKHAMVKALANMMYFKDESGNLLPNKPARNWIENIFKDTYDVAQNDSKYHNKLMILLDDIAYFKATGKPSERAKESVMSLKFSEFIEEFKSEEEQLDQLSDPTSKYGNEEFREYYKKQFGDIYLPPIQTLSTEEITKSLNEIIGEAPTKAFNEKKLAIFPYNMSHGAEKPPKKGKKGKKGNGKKEYYPNKYLDFNYLFSTPTPDSKGGYFFTMGEKAKNELFNYMRDWWSSYVNGVEVEGFEPTLAGKGTLAHTLINWFAAKPAQMNMLMASFFGKEKGPEFNKYMSEITRKSISDFNPKVLAKELAGVSFSEFNTASGLHAPFDDGFDWIGKYGGNGMFSQEAASGNMSIDEWMRRAEEIEAEKSLPKKPQKMRKSQDIVRESIANGGGVLASKYRNVKKFDMGGLPVPIDIRSPYELYRDTLATENKFNMGGLPSPFVTDISKFTQEPLDFSYYENAIKQLENRGMSGDSMYKDLVASLSRHKAEGTHFTSQEDKGFRTLFGRALDKSYRDNGFDISTFDEMVSEMYSSNLKDNRIYELAGIRDLLKGGGYNKKYVSKFLSIYDSLKIRESTLKNTPNIKSKSELRALDKYDEIKGELESLVDTEYYAEAKEYFDMMGGEYNAEYARPIHASFMKNLHNKFLETPDDYRDKLDYLLRRGVDENSKQFDTLWAIVNKYEDRGSISDNERRRFQSIFEKLDTSTYGRGKEIEEEKELELEAKKLEKEKLKEEDNNTRLEGLRRIIAMMGDSENAKTAQKHFDSMINTFGGYKGRWAKMILNEKAKFDRVTNAPQKQATVKPPKQPKDYSLEMGLLSKYLNDMKGTKYGDEAQMLYDTMINDIKGFDMDTFKRIKSKWFSWVGFKNTLEKQQTPTKDPQEVIRQKMEAAFDVITDMMLEAGPDNPFVKRATAHYDNLLKNFNAADFNAIFSTQSSYTNSKNQIKQPASQTGPTRTQLNNAKSYNDLFNMMSSMAGTQYGAQAAKYFNQMNGVYNPQLATQVKSIFQQFLNSNNPNSRISKNKQAYIDTQNLVLNIKPGILRDLAEDYFNQMNGKYDSVFGDAIKRLYIKSTKPEKEQKMQQGNAGQGYITNFVSGFLIGVLHKIEGTLMEIGGKLLSIFNSVIKKTIMMPVNLFKKSVQLFSGSIKKALGKSQAFSGLSELLFAPLLLATELTVIPVLQKLVPAIKNTIGWVVASKDKFTLLGQYIAIAVNKIYTAITGNFVLGLENTFKILERYSTWINEEFGKKDDNFFTGLGTDFKNLSTNIGNISLAVANANNSLISFGKSKEFGEITNGIITNMVETLGESLRTAIRTAVGMTKNEDLNLTGIIEKVLTDIIETGVLSTELIAKFMDSLFTSIQEILSDDSKYPKLLETMEKTLTLIMEKVMGIIRTIVTQDWFTTGVKDIVTNTSGIWGQMLAVSGLFGGASQALGTGIGKFGGWVGNKVSTKWKNWRESKNWLPLTSSSTQSETASTANAVRTAGGYYAVGTASQALSGSAKQTLGRTTSGTFVPIGTSSTGSTKIQNPWKTNAGSASKVHVWQRGTADPLDPFKTESRYATTGEVASNYKNNPATGTFNQNAAANKATNINNGVEKQVLKPQTTSKLASAASKVTSVGSKVGTVALGALGGASGLGLTAGGMLIVDGIEMLNVNSNTKGTDTVQSYLDSLPLIGGGLANFFMGFDIDKIKKATGYSEDIVKSMTMGDYNSILNRINNGGSVSEWVKSFEEVFDTTTGSYITEVSEDITGIRETLDNSAIATASDYIQKSQLDVNFKVALDKNLSVEGKPTVTADNGSQVLLNFFNQSNVGIQ